MYTLALMLWSLNSPASFEYRLVGNPNNVIVSVGNVPLAQNYPYFVRPAQPIVLTVTYMQGNQVRHRFVVVHLQPNMHTQLRISVPGRSPPQVIVLGVGRHTSTAGPVHVHSRHSGHGVSRTSGR